MSSCFDTRNQSKKTIQTLRPQTAASTTDHIISQLSSAPVADDNYHTVVPAKMVTPAAHAHTPILVKYTGSRKEAFDFLVDIAARTSLHVAKKIADVISSKPFNILLTTLSNKPVQLPKRMIAVHVRNSPAHVIATEAALLETDSEKVGAVHYEPSVDEDIQMTSHKVVETWRDQKLMHSCKCDVKP